MQGWESVRVVGELKILTRVSYSTLLMVPLLVALWPAVRLVVASYDDSRYATADALQQSADALQAQVDHTVDSLNQIENLPPLISRELKQVSEALRAAASPASAQSRQVANTLRSRPRARADFPITFAAAFYAALFISIGHFIYQMKAPEAIRHANRGVYVETAIDTFYKHPTQSAFDRALISLGITTFPDLPKIGAAGDEAAPADDRAAGLTQHADWIRRAADARYSTLVNSTPGWRRCTSACYLIGLSLIILILAGQAIAVLRETVPSSLDSTIGAPR